MRKIHQHKPRAQCPNLKNMQFYRFWVLCLLLMLVALLHFCCFSSTFPQVAICFGSWWSYFLFMVTLIETHNYIVVHTSLTKQRFSLNSTTKPCSAMNDRVQPKVITQKKNIKSNLLSVIWATPWSHISTLSTIKIFIWMFCRCTLHTECSSRRKHHTTINASVINSNVMRNHGVMTWIRTDQLCSHF